MYTLKTINIILTIIFFACYAYQFFYIPVRLFFAKRTEEKEKAKMVLVPHSFAFLICGRNEEAVIENLLISIKDQTYPSDHIDIYVVADNCTDRTADVCRAAGATVYERFNKVQVGKGYALDYLLDRICETHDDGYYDDLRSDGDAGVRSGRDTCSGSDRS